MEEVEENEERGSRVSWENKRRESMLNEGK